MSKAQDKLLSKALPTVLFTIFIDVLGIGILIPVLPLLVLPGPERVIPATWSITTGFIVLGWLTAIYPLMQFIATPILGQLSDKYGRRKVLSLSLLGTAVGYFLFAVAIVTKNLPLLFAARALDGITGGNLSVAQAVIADVSPPEKRTRNFGLIGAMFGLGFVLGPYIGAKLASPGISFYGLFNTPNWFGAATPFWFTGILSLINVMLVFFLLPETLKRPNKLLDLHPAQAFKNIMKAVTYPGLRVVFPSVFLYWGGFTFFTTFFQILLIRKLGFVQNNVGDYFAFIGICIAVTQGAITPLVAKHFKSYQVLRVSMVGTGLSLFALLFAHNTTELLLVTPFFAMFNGLTIANLTSLVSNSVGDDIQGEVLGINASVQALAQAIPAALTGYIATIGINTPVQVGGTIMICAGLLLWILYRPMKHMLSGKEAIATPVH